MPEKYQPWSPKAMAIMCAVWGAILAIVAIVWHGALAQPTLFKLIYPSFVFDAVAAVGVFVGAVVGFAIVGYIVALLYNWALKCK